MKRRHIVKKVCPHGFLLYFFFQNFLSRFDKETVKQFKDAISRLEKEDEKGLIIDLRNNGGGSLTLRDGLPILLAQNRQYRLLSLSILKSR